MKENRSLGQEVEVGEKRGQRGGDASQLVCKTMMI